MLRYSLKRVLELIPTTFGIILLTFILFHVVGGSPAAVKLGKNATQEAITQFNQAYGFDGPLFFNLAAGHSFFDSQFFHFVQNLVRGDFGVSIEYGERVSTILARGVGPSLSLTVPILVGGTLTALALAFLCAAYRGRFLDRTILMGSTLLMSVNYVVWVLAGQFLLAYKARLFPIWGYESSAYLVLPALIGIVSSLGVDVRFFRTAILDEIYKPYVRTAQAKGLAPHVILLKHVLRNALIPIVTYVSLSIPYLFTGSLMLERYFGIPGLGSVSINAINSSDASVLRVIVVLGALVYQGVNLVTDLCYAALDPRVRLS